VLLASPNSLGSIECEKELELAEALGKPIIPVIVRDLKPTIGRMAYRKPVIPYVQQRRRSIGQHSKTFT
jgi:hypothetical protein